MAKVYVGTYAKYNSGSLAGEWMDLEDYTDFGAFYDACLELHKDEVDPEFMYMDYEGFPESYYSESGLDNALWEWLELDEEDRVILELYRDNCGDGDIDQAREAFAGCDDSVEAWAEEQLDGLGELASIPSHLRYYFDFEKYARDLQLGGDIWTAEHEGKTYVFYNR